MPGAARLSDVAGKGGLVSAAGLPIDAGLLARFRAAGSRIQWREVAAPRRVRGRAAGTARIAHLHDEEARVESRDGGSSAATMIVESGPVGALVLVLEMDRRGPATSVTAVAAGERPHFDQGAIEARWGTAPSAPAGGPSLSDLVELARYALA